MNDTAKASLRQVRTRVLAILTSAVLLGSALASSPMLAGAVGASGTAEASTPFPATAAFASPGVCLPAPASGTQYSLTVTVNSPPSALRSLFVAVPNDYMVSRTSITVSPSTAVASLSSTQYHGQYYLSVTNLDVTNGSLTLTFTATPPTTSGTDAWFVEGETGPDHKPDYASSGEPNGDDFIPTSQPTTTVATGCKLAFSTEPTDAGKGQVITSTSLDPNGQQVEVQVWSSSNALVPVAVPVSLTLSMYPSSLSGGTGTTVGGSLTFPALAVGTEGTNYTLTASAPSNPEIAAGSGANPLGISNAFTIWDAAQPCTSSGCTLVVPPTANGESFDVTGLASAGGYLGASVDDVMIDCSPREFGGIPEIAGTHTITWTYTANATETITILIPRSLLGTLQAKLLAVHYMVCFNRLTTFPIAFPIPSGPPLSLRWTAAPDSVNGGFTGLLPDCEGNPATNPPCVLGRVWGSAGLTVTVSAPAGDPRGR